MQCQKQAQQSKNFFVVLEIQQNPVGSDSVGSEPHWEAILNLQKKFEISDFTRFLNNFT